MKLYDKINFLDCTLRDGGYYNNWEFELKLINQYLRTMSKTPIKHIEIGFFTIKKDNNLGITANINKNFFKKIEIPQNLNIGLMINISELLLLKNKYQNRLNDIDYKNIKFIRLACHLNEYKKIIPYLKFFKKKNIKIFLNLMQASEINISDLIYIKKNLQKYIDVFYFADSFGSMVEEEIVLLSKKINKNFNIPFGIHAHDNLSKAFTNSVLALKNDARWVDSTILGMGRGPGNTKTEELIYKIFKIKNSSLEKLTKTFQTLKKNYNWGTNQFYKISGKKKIHPTYVQMLLSDNRIKKNQYLNILKNINRLKAKKYDPNELYSNLFFKKKIRYKNKIMYQNFFKKFNEAIIISSNFNENFYNKNIIKCLDDPRTLKIMINQSQDSYLISKSDVISICHPLRLMELKKRFDQKYKKILIPFSNLPSQIKKIFIDKKKIIDFPILLKKKISIKKNYLEISEPLTLIYTLCILIRFSIFKVGLLGFKGFGYTDPFQDQTQKYILEILKKYKKLKLYSFNKTKFKF
jgi:4-hydroxy 2-oxovalerate aldolase